MDVIIPGHHVRLFCASLTCASRIGKDLYVEFDAAGGLVLRTLNDAKSAYACFRFQPHFFQRCTTPVNNCNSKYKYDNHRLGQEQQRRQRQQQQRKRRHEQASPLNNNNNSDNNDHDRAAVSSLSQSEKFICRVSLRALAAIVRQRKNELSLRIQSERVKKRQSRSEDDYEEETEEDDEHSEGGRLCLTFEFQWQAAAVKDNDGNCICNGEPPLLKVLHRIPVATVSHVSAAVARRDAASELQAHPSVFWRLLDPLKHTTEAALIIRADLHRIHASSFHPATSSNHENTSNNNNNAFLQKHNNDSLLKTETGISCDELEDFFFRQDRDESDDDEELPPLVNRQVILVFPIKEAKAFLLFASGQVSADHANASNHQTVDVFFYWGGKPIVWQIQQQQQQVLGRSRHHHDDTTTSLSSSWKAELILATLDHALLGTSSVTLNHAAAAAAATTD